MVALLAALIAGAALRFVGISWGLPYNLHVDEVAGFLHEPVRKEWNWMTEGWPRPFLASYGALPSYVFLAAKNAVWGSKIAHDWRHRTSDVERYLQTAYTHNLDMPGAYYWPRVTLLMRALAASMYTAALAIGILVAFRLWGGTTILWAALAMGGVPALVQHAHFFTGEAFIVLGTMMLLHACLRIADANQWRDYAYAAVALEIMTNAKVTTAIYAVFIVLAAWEHQRQKSDRILFRTFSTLADSGRLWACQVGWIAGWFVLNPAALFNAEGYFGSGGRSSVMQLIAAYRRGAPLTGWLQFYSDKPITYFATRLMVDGMGAVAAVIAWLAFAWVLFAERGVRRWPALFALMGLLPMLTTAVHTIRYLVPVLPVMTLCMGRFGALGWEAICDLPQRQKQWVSDVRDLRRWARVAAGTSTILAVTTSWFIAIATSRMHLQTDNRVAALHWLWTHATPTDRVVVGDHPSYRPPVNADWGVGFEPDAPVLTYNYLWRGNDGPTLHTARFIAIDGWDLRMVDVPSFRQEYPGRTAWLQAILTWGAPPGYRLAAKFDNVPNLLGWRRDESHAEILTFAFDHMPIFIYERIVRD